MVFWYADMIEKQTNIKPIYFTFNQPIALVSVFPLISIVLLFIANSKIRKDENLVRAADKLR